jgi:hypothetical protein
MISLAYNVACLWSFPATVAVACRFRPSRFLKACRVHGPVYTVPPTPSSMTHVGARCGTFSQHLSGFACRAHTAVAFCCGSCIILVFCPALLLGRVCTSTEY